MTLEAERDAQAVMDRILPDQTELHAALNTLPTDMSSGGYTIHMTRGAFAEYLRSMLYESIAPRYISQRKNWYDGMEIFLATSNTFPADCEQWTPGFVPRVRAFDRLDGACARKP